MHTDRLAAPSFKLLFAETNCHACQQPTPTCAVWVPSVEVQGTDGEDLSGYGPGPYWPDTAEDVTRYRLLEGVGPLEAEAKPSWSSWMEWV